MEHNEKKALEIFGREIAPAGTGMGKFSTKLGASACVPFQHTKQIVAERSLQTRAPVYQRNLFLIRLLMAHSSRIFSAPGLTAIVGGRPKP